LLGACTHRDRVLTVVYNTQNYRVSGLCLAFRILKGLKLALTEGFNRVDVSLPSPEDGNRSNFPKCSVF
jgi:hypothetical protein